MKGLPKIPYILISLLTVIVLFATLTPVSTYAADPFDFTTIRGHITGPDVSLIIRARSQGLRQHEIDKLYAEGEPSEENLIEVFRPENYSYGTSVARRAQESQL
jgi:hypothetical protein